MLFHSQRYNTPLSEFGIKKPFALDRGELVLAELRKEYGDLIRAAEPAPITIQDVLLVHTPAYVESLGKPETWAEIFELKPEEYDPAVATRPLNELFDDIALKSGGTKLAAEYALKQGLSANLGGGYHHAFPDQGRGFCALHDIAIAIRAMQKRGLCSRCLVVDVDFHQGDGTAVIFQDDPTVFTLSIHSQEGWPEDKQFSRLDVPVFSGEEHLYIEKLQVAIRRALESFSPDLVMFVAGSDAYELDVLPGTKFLNLTLEQMQERDELVIDTFFDLGLPLAMVFAGGYGPDVWQVHYRQVRRMAERLGFQKICEFT